MKSEIIEWLFYLPGLVSFFWIFIYRWRLFNPLRDWTKLHIHVEKNSEKEEEKYKLYYVVK